MNEDEKRQEAEREMNEHPFYQDRMIRVWAWDDAPEEYKSLSNHGGDEDWVALVPAGYTEYIPWLEDGSAFGVRRVSETLISNGTVYIGAHA